MGIENNLKLQLIEDEKEAPVEKNLAKIAYNHVKTPDEVDDLPEHEVVAHDESLVDSYDNVDREFKKSNEDIENKVIEEEKEESDKNEKEYESKIAKDETEKEQQDKESRFSEKEIGQRIDGSSNLETDKDSQKNLENEQTIQKEGRKCEKNIEETSEELKKKKKELKGNEKKRK